MEKVNYAIALEDCSDYVKYQLKIKRIRGFILKSILRFSLICFLALVIMVYRNYDIAWLFSLIEIWILIPCLVFFTYKYDLFHSFSKQLYNTYRSKIYEIEAKDDSISVTNEIASGIYKWEMIVDIYDTGKTFLVFITDNRAILIPKKAFENEEKAFEFFNFVNEKLKTQERK